MEVGNFDGSAGCWVFTLLTILVFQDSAEVSVNFLQGVGLVHPPSTRDDIFTGALAFATRVVPNLGAVT